MPLSRARRSSWLDGLSARLCQPAHVRFYPVDADPAPARASAMTLDQAAADDGGVGPPADCAHVLGRRDAEPERDRQRGRRADALAPAPRRRRRRVARAGDAEPRDRRTGTRCRARAALRIRASVVVGLSRKIVSMPRAAIASRKLAGLFDRQVEHEHAVDAGRRAHGRRTCRRPSAAPGSRR